MRDLCTVLSRTNYYEKHLRTDNCRLNSTFLTPTVPRHKNYEFFQKYLEMDTHNNTLG